MNVKTNWMPVSLMGLGTHNPADNKPDYGEYYAKTFGNIPMIVFVQNVSGLFFTKAEKAFYISFSAGGYAATIEMPGVSESFAKRCFEKILTTGLEIKAMPNLRYWTNRTKEWVIPFHVTEKEEKASNPPNRFDLAKIDKAEKKRQKRATRNLKNDRYD